jgi:glycerol-3-phosphate acyltransferase PlsY
MTLWLLILAMSYLLGSIPFGYLLVRFFRKEDIRAIGSGNIGATNVARSGAKGLGLLTCLATCFHSGLASRAAKA